MAECDARSRRAERGSAAVGCPRAGGGRSTSRAKRCCAARPAAGRSAPALDGAATGHALDARPGATTAASTAPSASGPAPRPRRSIGRGASTCAERADRRARPPAGDAPAAPERPRSTDERPSARRPAPRDERSVSWPTLGRSDRESWSFGEELADPPSVDRCATSMRRRRAGDAPRAGAVAGGVTEAREGSLVACRVRRRGRSARRCAGGTDAVIRVDGRHR